MVDDAGDADGQDDASGESEERSRAERLFHWLLDVVEFVLDLF